MKGLFLPEITTEDFRDGCLESIEALIGEGEIYDIEYPPEPCEDCISREETEKLLKCGCAYAIYDLPSVKPKVKTGHWVVDREAFRLNIRGKQTFDYSVHCDKCDYRCDYTTDVKGSLPSNYCPNCGADMRGDKKVRDKE